MLADVSDRDSDERKGALQAFSVAIAILPFNVEKVRCALEDLKRIGGENLAVEACCTAAAFEAMTRVVDSSIRKKDYSNTFIKVLRRINMNAFLYIQMMSSIKWALKLLFQKVRVSIFGKK